MLSIPDWSVWRPQTIRVILRTNSGECVDGVYKTGTACSSLTSGSSGTAVRCGYENQSSVPSGAACVPASAPSAATVRPTGTVSLKELRWLPWGWNANMYSDSTLRRAAGARGSL